MRLVAFVGLLAGLAQAQPAVTKVEPPNWWTRTTVSPLRVLIRGKDLSGATVSCDLKTANVKTNERGTYLFVDVSIPRNAKAGAHPLTVRTAAGTATAAFELLVPLDPKGRFQGFDNGDVMYLAMPDRFANGDPSNDNPEISKGLFDPQKNRYYHGGDFKGIRDHLPYLKDLGVTALWLNPWYDNNNELNRKEIYDGQPITDYHGYGAVDFYGVEEHFGTLRELQELVEAAHASGIKVIQDEVANHTGPYHPWVQDPPTPAWFHGSEADHINETWQLWPLIDPYASEALTRQTLDGWFINLLPDLNQDDPETARYLIQNTLWWIGVTGLDAIRMDTLPYVPRSFWKEWIAAITKEYPHVNVVGEAFDADPAIPSSFQNGALTVFDFPTYFKVRESIARGRSIRELAGMLAHDRMYPQPDNLVTFLGNHDVLRFMSEIGASIDRIKLAFTWVLTTRGIPLIYYGDEIAMEGGADPDNRRDFPAQAFATKGRSAEQQAVFAHVRALAHLRTSTPALQRGKTTNLCVSEQQWVYSREVRGQTAVVEINNADQPATISCAGAPDNLQTVIGTGSYGQELAAHSARVSVTRTSH